jgi:hypothetical protein
MVGPFTFDCHFRFWVFAKLSEPRALYLHPDLTAELFSANITEWSGSALFVHGDQNR